MSLVALLMNRDGMSREEALAEIALVIEEVECGMEPAEALLNILNVDADFEFEILMLMATGIR